MQQKEVYTWYSKSICGNFISLKHSHSIHEMPSFRTIGYNVLHSSPKDSPMDLKFLLLLHLFLIQLSLTTHKHYSSDMTRGMTV